MNKADMRRKMKQRLLNLSTAGTYHAKSMLIAKKLLDTTWWQEADVIAITISRGQEVDTKRLIEIAWSQGKTIAVPKCVSEKSEMIFRKITSFSQLEVVFFNLQEPIELQTEVIKKSEIDLILVPGVVFSSNGYRIGYGGGYYDRFLVGYEQMKVSLAFHEQIVQSVPVESHDIPVDAIITDEEIIHCAHK
ncbi:5-formyltetrahydrofolate cyclo-ligase [Priestia aryabhattai]|uniref:5-formyltetrahydrofolate cyclo-ligase n=1 Tax=Bacillaceae TaxID=186817 RepID=UPI000B9FABBF|nr:MULTISPECIES: 5-formyltetrahydrofolate cyclo-ligase [Bacillaceae]MDT2045468.1 5-formyltetrahydrofolate cyclo-ligase [Priestia flexa]OZT13472.1 5-formyltetrahydrofolate cyclo-ligase [Priestia aryabhattai]TDB50780.1 5-formyltetrahydrofolate cyclo-ligase [Bacillus sp. CBEL-1]